MNPKKTLYPTSLQVSANSYRINSLVRLISTTTSDLIISQVDAKMVRDKIDELRHECRVFNSTFNYSHLIP